MKSGSGYQGICPVLPFGSSVHLPINFCALANCSLLLFHTFIKEVTTLKIPDCVDSGNKIERLSL